MNMNMSHKEQVLRVQSRRSRGGCQTCKFKHVKCDEALPVCGRCHRTNKICRYVNDRPCASDLKFIVYTLPKEIGPSSTASPRESRTLWHFQQRTIKQLEGPFRSELWSIIVPRLSQDDAIVRQAVLALSAFHEHYLGRESPHAGPHEPEYALQCYQKARRQIIGLRSPGNSFDSILCACIIFCTCECLQGNFEEATRHAVAGMKIIAAHKTSTSSDPSMFASMENALSCVFLSLQSQVMDANVDDFQLSYPALEAYIGEVPGRFKNVEDALSHLQMLINQVLKLYQDAETSHELYSWVPSQILPSLRPEYEAIHTRYDAWTAAVSQMDDLVQSRDRCQDAGRILLEILACLLEVDLHVFVHGEATYDSSKEKLHNVLNLIEKFLQRSSDTTSFVSTNDHNKPLFSTYESLSFTSSPGVVPLLFEIATRTGHSELRQRAIQLMQISGRREGIWDGRIATRLAERITQLKRQGNAAAKNHPFGRKFLITDIFLLSEQKCMVRFGFKEIQADSFNSFWLETIRPDQGSLETQIIDIT